MSAYNTNYAPNGQQQANLVNGMPQQQQQQSQQQQQQQQYQQQQYLQQQQQLLQQKQQQQQQQPQQQSQFQPPYQQQQAAASNLPPPQFNSNAVNKFLPPTSQPLSNGPPPPHAAFGTAMATQSPPTPLSHLPPHLRPATQNGPPSPASASPAATNGSHGPSRNASPGLGAAPPATPPKPNYATPPQQQQQQQQKPPQAAAPLLQQQQQPAAAVGQLTNDLQNLYLLRSNGLAATPTAPPKSAPLPPPALLTTAPRPQTLAPHGDQRGVAVGLDAADSQASAKLAADQLTQNPMLEMFSAAVPAHQHAASIFGNTAAPKLAKAPPTTQKIFYGTQQPAQLLNNNNSPAAMQARPPTGGAGAGGVTTAPLPGNWPKQQPLLPPAATRAMPTMPPMPLLPPQQGQAQGQVQVQAQAPAFAPPPTAQQQQQRQQQQQQQQKYAYAPAYPPQQQPQPQPPFGAQPGNSPLQYQSQPQPQQQLQQQPQPGQQLQPGQQPLSQPLSVTQQGFSRLWGQDTIDLMQMRHILSPATLPPPKVVLHNQFHESINCSPSIMRCTLAKIPESNALLQKSRLPLGIVIHPFRDVNSLPVIQCINIVRCRLCRTYINPFVYFVDSKMWKCNLCYRVNELPEDFQFDPATKTYGDVTRRPEVRSSTIEFIAPSEYMLRPPQPAMYLFLFDVSIIAQQSGYLEAACSTLNRHLDEMPGDARTQVGFICYDSFVHFYSMSEGLNQPHEMTLLDIEDIFLPRPDSLLVNLRECKELVRDLLKQLPQRFAHTHDPGSALGAALQVAFKLMQASGGRITVFQSCLPNKGPGSLEPREDPNNRSAKDVAHLNPATDFYKRYALECSGYQIAVDLFLMNQQYSDMATISGVSKHSGGCVHHFPLYQKTKQHHVDSFRQCFKRYLTRKIGFEAVMRIRCTRGLQVHTFHGNFFVRSTDLLSLPNVNPDAGYGMQISYEESLTDVKTICFQAALLYTNSEGERRIRVHTVCLPVTASLPEVMHSADTEAIVGLLSKMAVDRSIGTSLSDARDAFINATIDIFNAFKIAQNLPSGQSGQLIAPRSLALLPLYILALLKHPAFRVGTSTRLDDRVHAMDCMKTLPLDQLMKNVYPELYKIDSLLYHARNSNVSTTQDDDDDEDDPLPEMQRLQLSAEHLDSRSIFLMDCGALIILYVGLNVPPDMLESVLGISSTAELADYVYGLPNVVSAESDVLKRFILRLNYDKPYAPLVQIIRDTSTAKALFIERLVDDRSESSLSYYEFLQHIRAQVK